MKQSRLIRYGMILMVALLTLTVFARLVSAQATLSPDVKSLVEQYYSAIANQPDLSLTEKAMPKLLDPDFAFYVPNATDPEVGLKPHLDFITTDRSGFPDLNFAVDEMIAEDNAVAVRWTLTGKNTGTFLNNPATGNAISLQGMDMFHIKNGLITDLHRYFDVQSLTEQIYPSK